MTWDTKPRPHWLHLIFHPARTRHNARQRSPASILATLFALASASACPSPARLKSPRFQIDCILIAHWQVNAGTGKRIEKK